MDYPYPLRLSASKEVSACRQTVVVILHIVETVLIRLPHLDAGSRNRVAVDSRGLCP